MSVSMSIPLDSDGFLRRECPSCEQQFKWFPSSETSPDSTVVDQYFCPLCGIPSGLDTWWTRDQLRNARALLVPEAHRIVSKAIEDAFKGSKNVTFKRSSTGAADGEVPEALYEPNDMIIVEPPCHPSEPVKVPDAAAARVHCLICGEPFSA